MRSAALRDSAIPEFVTPRRESAVAGRRVRNQAVYESGSQAKRLVNWRPPTVSPNAMLGSLASIRDRSRDAARNNGYGKGVLDKLVTNLIGTGIKPLSQAPDPDFRKAVQALWLRWTDESDADGQLDFYGQQAQATRGWLEAGDSLGRLRPRLTSDGLSVPLQVQLIEPELCPHTYNGFARGGSNRIRAGIEFDAIGRRVAYYFHPSRPELDDFDASQLRRVPTREVVHLYDPLRTGQLRGLPILTQALVKLNELDKFDDATLLRQQIANLFALFITRDPSPGDVDEINPLTGAAKPTGASADDPVTLEPGTAQELQPGEDVKFSDPPDPPAGYADFMRTQLRAVSVATGVPYEVLTGDMTGITDRTVRVVLNEFKRRMQMLQHGIVAFKFNRPIWRAWMDAAIQSGALPTPPGYGVDTTEPWAAVKWMPARWAYLHPVQDVEADKAAIRSGFTSRSAVVSEYGEDAEQIDAEQALDNARADELGLMFDSDPRYTSQAGLTQARVGETSFPSPDDKSAEGDTQP